MSDSQAGSGVDDDDDDAGDTEDDEDNSEEEEHDGVKLTNGTNRFSLFTFILCKLRSLVAFGHDNLTFFQQQYQVYILLYFFSLCFMSLIDPLIGIL